MGDMLAMIFDVGNDCFGDIGRVAGNEAAAGALGYRGRPGQLLDKRMSGFVARTESGTSECSEESDGSCNGHGRR